MADIDTNTDVREFIDACEKLCREQGNRSHGFVGGVLFSSIQFFDSPGLEVSRTDDGALEIRICYRDEDGKTRENPVVCRNNKGELYRVHGEWVYGVPRAASLLAGKAPDTPITLGRDGQNWLVPLD